MTDLKLEHRTGLVELLGRAAKAVPEKPDTRWRHIRACLASADEQQAIIGLRTLTASHPDDAEAWKLLTTLLLSSARAEDAVTAGRTAATVVPADSFAHSGLGWALRAVGADEEADREFERAWELDAENRHAVRGLGQALIRRRDGEALLRHTEAALARLGASGWLIAQYAIALALLGRADPLAQLHDHDRLVLERELGPPDGFPTLEAFNHSLREELERVAVGYSGAVALDILHKGRRIKGGPQAALAAYGASGAPASAALLAAFERERSHYEAWLAEGGDSWHLRSRPCRDHLLTDAVITERQGYVALHTHACTWLSAVYYASVPPETGKRNKGGCMEFAPPDHKVPLADGLWPSRLVRPRPGLMVFFPAYMYHHVYPNELQGQRVVVTFDVMPSDYSSLVLIEPDGFSSRS